MDKIIPIIECCEGKDEYTSAIQFANHFPEMFKNVERVKSKGIKRCYFIFYDDPKNNKFLSKLKIVFHYHGGCGFSNVYEYKNVLIAISATGAPVAASLMEELSVFGIKEFIAIGSAGCLDETISNKFLLVSKAIRDEGTSYHYLKPDTYVSTSTELNKELSAYLKSKELDYIKGITWTNDAFYRETKQKINMAKLLGAKAVEMECSAWCAVAKYRKLKFSQILYFSDVVNQNAWSRLTWDQNCIDNVKDKIILMVKDMIDNMGV